jgi:DNA repair protein RadA/Sms
MAKKPIVRFVCSNCGAVHSSWAGRCSQCGEWNTLEEQLSVTSVGGKVVTGGSPLSTGSVTAALKADHPRLKTGLSEVDDVLGGGFVAGSINLIAGQPGIGKSTLLLQVANLLAKTADILYVSGEESSHQIGLRASRLKTDESALHIATSTVAEDVAATVQSGKYKLVVVDSIQTIACAAVASSAGSVAQITNSAQLITQAAKATGTAVILVGHVTKEGTIAGPKVLDTAASKFYVRSRTATARPTRRGFSRWSTRVCSR